MLIAERNLGDPQFRGLPQLEVGGLTEAGVAEILASRGHSETDAARLTEVTAGNPLAVLELAGTSLVSGEPTPSSDALRTAFLAQVSRLSQETIRALLVVSVSGPSDMPFLEQALGDRGASVKDLATAESAGIITLKHGVVGFRHPLLQSAVYYDASPEARRAAHLAFARAMASSTVPALAQRRIVHLDHAAGGADEALAAEFEAAGKQSAAQAAFGVAADTLERAAMLSLSPDLRSTLRRGRGVRAFSLGRLFEVDRLLTKSLEWGVSDQTRVAVAHLSLRSMLWQGVPDRTYRRLAVNEVAG